MFKEGKIEKMECLVTGETSYMHSNTVNFMPRRGSKTSVLINLKNIKYTVNLYFVSCHSYCNKTKLIEGGISREPLVNT